LIEFGEGEVSKVPAPPSYAQEFYDLRLHVEFVQRRLAARSAEGAPARADGRLAETGRA
jgi:hypothetical protein